MPRIKAGRTIRGKLLLTMAGLTVGACLLFGLSSSLRLQEVTLKQTRDSLTTLTELVARNLSAGLDFRLTGSVREELAGLFGIEQIQFAIVLEPDGETFVSMGDSRSASFDTSPATATTILQESGILIASSPIYDATNRMIGTLVLGYSLGQTREILRANLIWLLAVTLGLTLVSILIAHTLGRRLTTPLLRLTESARRLASGISDEPVRIESSDDEVRILAETYNAMTARLVASRNEAERNNEQLEAKVRERTEELRQKNITLEMQNRKVLEVSRLKSTFLANVSHELRTPLNAILALSELLRDGIAGDLTVEQRMHAEMVHRSGVHLLRLINDLLDLSKIEAGRVEIHPVHCDILEELRTAAGEMVPLANSKQVELREMIEPGAKVMADAGRIRQIFINILGNAIKFTDRGHVEIRAGIDQGRGELTVEVIDTGIGIAPEDLEAIFQEFRQVDTSPNRKSGGTGLGLAISKRLAELMGGKLEVESHLGEGSRFRFVTPVAIPDTRSEGAAVAQAA